MTLPTKFALPVDVEWKAGASSGELEGFASVFGTVDLEGDVVMPGAFRKTIDDWRKSAQTIPLLADHDISSGGVIGSVVDLSERSRGLWFRALFGRTQKAQDIRANYLDGHQRGVSFTYAPVRATPGSGEIGGKAVRRFLHELRIFEVTLAPFPIHPDAIVTGAKADGDLDELAAKALIAALDAWGESMQHALGITSPTARKAAVAELIREYPSPDSAAGSGDGPATAPDAAGNDAGTSAPDAAADIPDDGYAATFLAKHGPPDGAPNGAPPATALPGPLADLDRARSTEELAALEADIQRALE